jgi:hypothetical protein
MIWFNRMIKVGIFQGKKLTNLIFFMGWYCCPQEERISVARIIRRMIRSASRRCM